MSGQHEPAPPAPPLQELVTHARRLAELLRTRRLVSAPIDDWAVAWMTGREEEIERFLELTVSGRSGRSGRARGKMDDATAAAVLAGYLASLHEGMARRLGLHRPACCRAAGGSASSPGPHEAITREVPLGSTPADPHSPTYQSVEELLANLDSWTEPGGAPPR